MELTYLVRGADGKEYGPVKLEELCSWVEQRRLRGRQEVKRSDMDYWSEASAFLELQDVFGSTPGITSDAAQAAIEMEKNPSVKAWLRSHASLLFRSWRSRR